MKVGKWQSHPSHFCLTKAFTVVKSSHTDTYLEFFVEFRIFSQKLCVLMSNGVERKKQTLDLRLKTRRVKTCFKIAVVTGFANGLVKHCKNGLMFKFVLKN
jgi:hypothetical protein